MATVSPLPVASHSPLQPPLPTPSPFSYSVASTGIAWSSRPPLKQLSNIVLRLLALLLSFVSALSLSLNFPSSNSQRRSSDPSFHEYPTLMYCFIVNMLALFYSVCQLFKSIWDIAHKGFCISDRTSDYLSFIFDQLVGWLLISSSSVAVPTIQQIDSSKSLWKPAVVSVTMSFVTVLVVQACALLSGYKLFKRIVW